MTSMQWRAVTAVGVTMSGLALAGPPLDDPIPELIATSTVHVLFEPVCDGLVAPNWGTTAPGLPGQLFVVDQPGQVWSIDLSDGSKHLFLDASSLLVPLGIFGKGSFDERGLLGLAFHPDYAKNGLLYTYTSEEAIGIPDFTTMPDGELANHQTVITEWNVKTPGDPASTVNTGSARVLLRVDQPQFNHNAGALEFGHDGYLYIALGDGGGADDRDGQDFIGVPLIGHGDGNAQDITNPLGSILRIDPNGDDSANGEYGIPKSNPFVDPKAPAEAVDEIYGWGFRNPFRFSVDQGTGDIYVADVGQNDIEEIDLLTAGNFGWNTREGSFCFDHNNNEPGFVTACGPEEGMIDPIAEYDHDEGIAIVGGFVYRGSRIPALAGSYVFGEFAVTFTNDGRLFHLNDNTILEFNLLGQDGVGLSILGFGQDAAGEVYLLANSTGTPFGDTGVVLRIAPFLGDLDADGDVDISDLRAFLSQWDGPGSADFDGDGVVGILDLLIMLGQYGETP